jgi:hypothetical protein
MMTAASRLTPLQERIPPTLAWLLQAFPVQLAALKA